MIGSCSDQGRRRKSFVRKRGRVRAGVLPFTSVLELERTVSYNLDDGARLTVAISAVCIGKVGRIFAD